MSELNFVYICLSFWKKIFERFGKIVRDVILIVLWYIGLLMEGREILIRIILLKIKRYGIFFCKFNKVLLNEI